jgi:hypothetical protein
VSAIHHGEALARERDLRQILGACGAFRQALGLIDVYVAKIVGVIAERRQALVQIGRTDGGGPHVHAAAVSTHRRFHECIAREESIGRERRRPVL